MGWEPDGKIEGQGAVEMKYDSPPGSRKATMDAFGRTVSDAAVEPRIFKRLGDGWHIQPIRV
jgi:hypothetical protein